MDTVRVKKIVAVCFFEAVKVSLDHLGTHRMSLAAENGGGATDLTRIYGEVRRLRDYLQRCTAAYHDHAELNLSIEDRALLVASCRRYVESIDARLAGSEVTDPRERQFLIKKQQTIADWTVELAVKPLLEFPLPRTIDKAGDGGRALKARLDQKLYALNKQSLISGGTMKPVAGSSFGNPGMLPATQGTEPVTKSGEPDDESDVESPVEATGDLNFGSPAMLNAQAQMPLVDPRAVQDPRIRALVSMDLRSLGLAEAGGDYRLSTVLMATILEAVVLDYAIPRRNELQLTGGPETWHPQEILFKVLGDSASPSDRSLAYNLFYSRKLLSPVQQIISPIVATKASTQGLREFVERMLHQLGFVNVASQDAPNPA